MFCFLASLSGVLAGVSCLFSFSVSISSIAFSSSAIICPANFGAHCRVAADMRAATLTNHKEKQVPWFEPQCCVKPLQLSPDFK